MDWFRRQPRLRKVIWVILAAAGLYFACGFCFVFWALWGR